MNPIEKNYLINVKSFIKENKTKSIKTQIGVVAKEFDINSDHTKSTIPIFKNFQTLQEETIKSSEALKKKKVKKLYSKNDYVSSINYLQFVVLNSSAKKDTHFSTLLEMETDKEISMHCLKNMKTEMKAFNALEELKKFLNLPKKKQKQAYGHQVKNIERSVRKVFDNLSPTETIAYGKDFRKALDILKVYHKKMK